MSLYRALAIMFVATAAGASPSFAAMDQDLANCRAADSSLGVAACSRIITSGRLPRSQYYIAYINRGWAYRNGGEQVRALSDFEKAIELNRDSPEAVHSRAVIQFEMGRTARSLADLDRYIELKPESGAGYYTRAIVHRHMGEFDTALEDLQKGPTKDSKSRVLRALILSDKGDHGAGLAEANRVIEEDEKRGAGYYARALIKYRQKEFGVAEEDVRQAITLDASIAVAHTLLGRLLETKGDSAGAKDAYEHALKLPMKHIDGRSARDEANERLAALAAAPAEKPNFTTASAPSPAANCQRFIPSAGITIPVACNSD